MDKVLTISVASYNISKYIDKLAESIIQANADDVVEVLFVNDGSKDDTAVKAKEYQDNFPTLFRLINKENAGHGSTINRGIEEATGKYFRALDGDDWLNSKSLSELVSVLKKTDVDLVLCDYDYCHADGSKELQTFDKLEHMRIYDFNEIKCRAEWMCYHTLIYKTEILRDNRIRLDENCFYVDSEYNLYPIPYVHSILYFGKPVYCYRIGIEGQSVSPESRKKNISHSLKVAKALLDFTDKEMDCISETQRDYLVQGTADQCVWHIHSLLMFPLSIKYLKMIKDFDQQIMRSSPLVYKKMEDFGKRSKAIKSLRRTAYCSYWYINIYKALKKR